MSPADVLDIWVNVVTPRSASDFTSQEGYEHVAGYLGATSTGGNPIDALINRMDELGVATGITCPGMQGDGVEKALELAEAHPGRILVAAGITDPAHPTRNVKHLRELAKNPLVAMARVMPLFTQVPINDPLHFPVYAALEELGLPVAINVGIPGPRVRSRVQHPELLEDVMIAFPDLVIIGAHMGHPFEELFMNYMRKWDNLYLSCTAYAPNYFDPALVKFMNSKTYRGRVIWGSDDPWFPMERSITEARNVPLDDDAMALFLGGTARRLLDRTAR